MKQKLIIGLVFVLLIGVLVALNAASYAGREKAPETEIMPNRSSYNDGPTGTKAFYDLLNETGRKVIRWQENPSALLPMKKDGPAVFVVVGRIRREFEDVEVEQLFKWVAEGGRLVIVDREPAKELVTTTANWEITIIPRHEIEVFNIDPTDQVAMTREAAALRPKQPTLLSSSVNAIQASRFASAIHFQRLVDIDNGKETDSGTGSGPPPPPPAKSFQLLASNTNTAPTPLPPVSIQRFDKVEEIHTDSLAAPVVHFAQADRNIVVDAPYGQGRVVYVSDPYIYSNAGIGLADNVQFAINSVNAGAGSLIAFDEYHQGFGRDRNRFLEFFAGTPVIAIFVQAALLLGLVFFSQSRRFARPVPEPEPDRLTKLEYVSAMAELQQRSHAYDLAIENIYSDFRRRAARSVGLDNTAATYADLAGAISERTGDNVRELSALLFKCEDIIRGEATNRAEVLDLTARLRTLESKLNISRAERSRGPVHGR